MQFLYKLLIKRIISSEMFFCSNNMFVCFIQYVLNMRWVLGLKKQMNFDENIIFNRYFTCRGRRT